MKIKALRDYEWEIEKYIASEFKLGETYEVRNSVAEKMVSSGYAQEVKVGRPPKEPKVVQEVKAVETTGEPRVSDNMSPTVKAAIKKKSKKEIVKENKAIETTEENK